MDIVRTVSMATQSDTAVITIEGPDGKDEVTLPTSLLDLLSEENETAAEVVGDIALLSCTQRIHTTVHHSEEEVSDELSAIEDSTMDLFEERFGVTFAEATGHDH
jgi:AraC-like DNA-binding protein